jgi:hypothetical protein
VIKEYQLQILSVKENSTRYSGCHISFSHKSQVQNIHFDADPLRVLRPAPKGCEVKVGVLKSVQLFKIQYFDKVNAFNGSPVTDVRPCFPEIAHCQM